MARKKTENRDGQNDQCANANRDPFARLRAIMIINKSSRLNVGRDHAEDLLKAGDDLSRMNVWAATLANQMRLVITAFEVSRDVRDQVDEAKAQLAAWQEFITNEQRGTSRTGR